MKFFTIGLRVCTAAALVVIAALSTAATAGASDVPFWERADQQKLALQKMKLGKTMSAKSSSKSAKQRYGANATSKKRAAYNASSGKIKVAAKRKKLGGYAEATETRKKKVKGVRVAALGNSYYPDPSPKKSLTGGSVRWVASSGCLDAGIKSVVYQIAANFGPLTVSSTCRGKSHNRKVGGARKSKHLTGDAADLRVHGNPRGLYAFLRSHGSVGGVHHYGGGLYHIDNGPRRTW